MKLIKDLEELIEDEIHDVEKYAKMALHLKSTNPTLAQILYNISVQEDSHRNVLHNEIVKLIENHRDRHGDPPAAMQAVYDYLHERHIEDMADARRYQEMYKNA